MVGGAFNPPVIELIKGFKARGAKFDGFRHRWILSLEHMADFIVAMESGANTKVRIMTCGRDWYSKYLPQHWNDKRTEATDSLRQG